MAWKTLWPFGKGPKKDPKESPEAQPADAAAEAGNASKAAEGSASAGGAAVGSAADAPETDPSGASEEAFADHGLESIGGELLSELDGADVDVLPSDESDEDTAELVDEGHTESTVPELHTLDGEQLEALGPVIGEDEDLPGEVVDETPTVAGEDLPEIEVEDRGSPSGTAVVAMKPSAPSGTAAISMSSGTDNGTTVGEDTVVEENLIPDLSDLYDEEEEEENEDEDGAFVEGNAELDEAVFEPVDQLAVPARGAAQVERFLQLVREAEWLPWFANAATELDGADDILGQSDERRLEMIRAAYHRLSQDGLIDDETGMPEPVALEHLIARLARYSLPYEDEDLRAILRAVMAARPKHAKRLEITRIVGQIERLAERDRLSDELKEDIALFHRWCVMAQGLVPAKVKKRLVDSIASKKDIPLVPRSAWGRAVTAWLKEQDKPAHNAWKELLIHIREAAGRPKPTRSWIAQAEPLIAAVGPEVLSARITTWLRQVDPFSRLDEVTVDRLVGFIWVASTVDDGSLARSLGHFADRCLTSKRSGRVAQRLGRACIYTLAEMPGGWGVVPLSDLNRVVTHKNLAVTIDNALSELGERLGYSREDLEELAVPDFGLDEEGSRWESVGEYEAELRVVGNDVVELRWHSPDGGLATEPPADLLQEHADEVEWLVSKRDEISEVVKGMRQWVERLFLAKRTWTVGDWRARYTEHPLLSGLSRSLVWNFMDPESGDAASGMFIDGEFIDQQGEEIDWIHDDAFVSVWHPITASKDEIEAWKGQIVEREVVQPFTQVHREIFRVSDAERMTMVYTDRFGGHIVRQGEFLRKSQPKGWGFTPRIGDESGDFPTKPMPAWHVTMELWVGPVLGYEEEGVGLAYLMTESLRFADPSGRAIPVDYLPEVVFSEGMREVAMLIEACSVGREAEWEHKDRGETFSEYWQRYAFGPLDDLGRLRREVLAGLVEELEVAEACEIEGAFLYVQGQLNRYAIHLGSGHVRAGDRHIPISEEIVARLPMPWVTIPYEGAGKLVGILKKAILLAEDEDIADEELAELLAGE